MLSTGGEGETREDIERKRNLYTEQIQGLRSRELSFPRQPGSTGEDLASFPLGKC